MTTNQLGSLLAALGFTCAVIAGFAYDSFPPALGGILGGVMIFITGLLFGASD
jgi:hypothetical protein